MICCGLPFRKADFWSRSLCVIQGHDIGETHNTRLYFGYGSNLWKDQMKRRCPTSKYLGIARLKGYRWIIYKPGYANIVKIEQSLRFETEKHSYANEVWGLVYSMQPDDEDSLDGNEGVPIAYQKEDIKMEFWPAKNDDPPATDKKSKSITALVYINHEITEIADPKKEYIHRMNMGIRDAIREGMPLAYVEDVIRKFIPNT